MSSQVSIRHDGPVAVLTLDRPEARNAFTQQMADELSAAYRACDADDSVRAVVLTGAGDSFCVGADVAGRGEEVFAGPSDPSGFRSDPFTFHAWECRKPVIAAVNGHAIGIGCTMTLHCDLRIWAAEARWGIVQVRRGVVPDCRAHWTLPRLVGVGAATEILLGGRRYRGEDALRLGLAHQVVAAAEVLPTALGWAHELATQAAPLSLAATKQLLWSDVDDSERFDEAERRWHLHLMGRADAREGVAAFLARRDPVWEGRLSADWPDGA
jgi:enoyl-CoA hydratase/carnithine racemase